MLRSGWGMKDAGEFWMSPSSSLVRIGGRAKWERAVGDAKGVLEKGAACESIERTKGEGGLSSGGEEGPGRCRTLLEKDRPVEKDGDGLEECCDLRKKGWAMMVT